MGEHRCQGVCSRLDVMTRLIGRMCKTYHKRILFADPPQLIGRLTSGKNLNKGVEKIVAKASILTQQSYIRIGLIRICVS